MNDTPAPENQPVDDDALKRRLLNRIAIAAVIVVGLLGSLAMFDVIFAPPAPAPAKLASLPAKEDAPAPAAPASAAAPATEPVPAATAGTESAAAATTEEKPVAEGTAAPDAPPLQTRSADRPLTKPATGRQAMMRPSEPVPPATSPASRPDPARELAASPTGPKRAPASRPLTSAAERQYALQMGVFGNLANAEDLRAKLELHGIPSSIEARVHAGPFRTREEAELARAKLKELGLDGGLLVTAKAR